VSSKRAMRRKACAGKQRFATEAEARSGIAAVHRGRGYVGLMVPYRCQFCGGFHFGHPPRRVRQAMRAEAR